MTERRLSQRIEALIDRNKKHFDELKQLIGDDRHKVFSIEDGQISVGYSSPEDDTMIAVTKRPKKGGVESYYLGDIGLISAGIFGVPVQARTGLGLDHRIRVRRATVHASDFRYSFRFCNQIENIVRSVKEQIKGLPDAKD